MSPDEPAPEEASKAPGEQLRALGEFIREQRNGAELSLRALAEKANVSNPYLSQIERGLHEPSVRVLTSIAKALNLSAETLLRQAGALGEGDEPVGNPTEAAIGADPRLTAQQKRDLLAVYRAYIAE